MKPVVTFARSYLIDRMQENNMRITANQLRKIIREELERADEAVASILKSEIKQLLDAYIKNLDLLPKDDPEKFQSEKKTLDKKIAQDFKDAKVTGSSVKSQISAYRNEVLGGGSKAEKISSLADTIVKHQEQMQEAVRRLLRRL